MERLSPPRSMDNDGRDPLYTAFLAVPHVFPPSFGLYATPWLVPPIRYFPVKDLVGPGSHAWPTGQPTFHNWNTPTSNSL